MNETMKPGMPPKGMPPMGGGHFPFAGPGGPGGPGMPGPPPEGWEPPMADISWVKNKHLDVPYAHQSKAQGLDIYQPEEGEGPFPVLIHIHGGGFALGDKRDDHMDAYLPGIRRDYVVVSVEYRLSGEAIFPAAVLDVREAIRFLKKNATQYKIDANRIAVIGGSAGGNLTAMLAMNIPNGEFPGEAGASSFDTEPTIHVAVDQFGPTDFIVMDDQARANGVSFVNHDAPESAESKYIGTPIPKADPELCAQANPMTYISEKMCPLLIQHGRIDKLVPFQQSEIFYDAIVKKLGPGKAEFMPLDTADHEDRQFFTEPNMSVVWDYITKHLK